MERRLTYIELYGGLNGLVNKIVEETPKIIHPGQEVKPLDPVVQELESILKECKKAL